MANQIRVLESTNVNHKPVNRERSILRGILVLAAILAALVFFYDKPENSGWAYISGVVAIAGLACSSRP